MIRPKTGQVLLRILTPMESKGGIVFGQHTITPEERQQMNHHPEPPPPLTAQVVAIGPWPKLANGLAIMPAFPPGSKVLIRPGTGTDLVYGAAAEKLKLVKSDDILAVVEETS